MDRKQVEVQQLSKDGVVLQGDLQAGKEDPVALFKTRIANGTPDLEMVRLSLVEQTNRLRKYSRVQRRAILRAENIGGLTSKWLWEDDERWVSALVGSFYQLGGVPSSFLAGEGRDDFVIAQLRIPMPPAIAARMPEKDQYLWRGILLRGVIQTHLTVDCKSSADPALDFFFKVRDEIRLLRPKFGANDPEHPILSISLWPSTVGLGKLLSTGSFHRTSTRKYDAFLKHLDTFRSKTEQTDVLAFLHLVHRSSPDADPLIQFLQRDLAENALSKVHVRVEQDSGFMKALGHAIIRADPILRRHGRPEDARWLGNYANRLLCGGCIRQLAETTFSPPKLE